MSASKKVGQTTVVLQYCGLSKFFLKQTLSWENASQNSDSSKKPLTHCVVVLKKCRHEISQAGSSLPPEGKYLKIKIENKVLSGIIYKVGF